MPWHTEPSAEPSYLKMHPTGAFFFSSTQISEAKRVKFVSRTYPAKQSEAGLVVPFGEAKRIEIS